MLKLNNYRLLFMVSIFILAGALTANAQYQTFVVDDDGDPGTTYPTLGEAIATAQTYAGGPHKIVIMPGAYSDYNLTYNPAKIDEIYGDPGFEADEMVFTSPVGTYNFLTAGTDLSLKNMKLVGYAGYGIYAPASGVTIEDLIIEGASGTGVNLTGSSGAELDGLTFSNLDNGVYGNGVTGATIQNCTFTNCTYGANLNNFTTGGMLDYLTITGGTYGIYLNGGTGTTVQNCTIDNTSNYGIKLNNEGGTLVQDNLLYMCGNYGVVVTNTNYYNAITNNCLIDNAGGTSQGYDGNNPAIDGWVHNYYSDNNYTMDPGYNTDGNPWKYEINAQTADVAPDYEETFTVDFAWEMPSCGDLDSLDMAAYTFTVNYDPTKLQYTGTAGYYYTYLGDPDPALYTDVDDGTPGQLIFAAINFSDPGVNGGVLTFAEFKAIAANTTDNVYMTGIDFRDQGNNPIPAGNTALTLTLEDNEDPVMISLTANEPAGDNVYSDGSTAGPGPWLKLYLTMTAEDNYDLDKFQWKSDAGSWSDWMPVSGSHPITSGSGGPQQFNFVSLGLPEGTHTAWVQVKDMAGHVSAPLSYEYVIDWTPPEITTLTLADFDSCAADPGFTNDSTIQVTIVPDGSTDIDSMEFWRASVWEGRLPYASNPTYPLPNVPGPYQITMKLTDKYNNEGTYVTPYAAIELDTSAPVPTEFVLGSKPYPGPDKTKTLNINWDLTYWGGSGAMEYNVNEDISKLVCGDAGWTAFVSLPVAITLSDIGDGYRKVYFATRDHGGNISAIIYDSIYVDQTPVDFTDYELEAKGVFPCSNDNQVWAYYSWTGDDADDLQWSYDNSTWASWKSLVGETSPDTTGGNLQAGPEGWKKIYAKIVDDIGNESAVLVDSVYYDPTPPTLGTVTADDINPTADPDPVLDRASNEATFELQMTGLATDVVDIAVSEDGGSNWTWFTVSTGGSATFNMDYPWTTPTECSWYVGKVKTRDCAGNESPVVNFDGSGVYFDFTAPTASIVAPTPTMSKVLGITVYITASDNCGLNLMRLGEGSLDGVAWVGYSASTSFTLQTGDSVHTINLEVADYGGNIATASWDVRLDQQAPTAGTFVITSGNPLAFADYTSDTCGNTAVITPDDADVMDIKIKNDDGSHNTNWVDFYTMTQPYALACLDEAGGDPDVKTVMYKYRDSTYNESGWFTASINYSSAAPLPPTAVTGTPGSSCMLEWTNMPNVQKYLIRYNFQNQYPTYPDPIPPNPANMTEGIFEDTVLDTCYNFIDHNPDIYAFSVWSLSNYGVYSIVPNMDYVGTNYILGDFSPEPDGCIKFSDEFGALAIAYNSVSTDPNWNDSLDIAPTSDASATGYPMPDLAIDFEDLIIFALNYDVHHCGASAKTRVLPDNLSDDIPAALTVTLTVPEQLLASEECVVPVVVDAHNVIKGYHLIFDYDQANVELVRVEAGAAYEDVDKSFFYVNQQTSRVDVSGTIFGEDAVFTNDELFRIVLRAKNQSNVDIDDVELTFRDRSNKDITASLSLSQTAGNMPKDYALMQNYPNPFNPTTTIVFALPVSSKYNLTIYNVMGQVVEEFSGHAPAGIQTVVWDASKKASGIYFYKLNTGDFTETKKMILLK